jgi:hypothetical protein
VVQAAEHLLCKHEALILNRRPTKTKKVKIIVAHFYDFVWNSAFLHLYNAMQTLEKHCREFSFFLFFLGGGAGV